MGGDFTTIRFYPLYFKISIHTTRVGGDKLTVYRLAQLEKFQSTPPVWVVTAKRLRFCRLFIFQSTPPVWVVTLFTARINISITKFQSTPPVWVVTNYSLVKQKSLIYFNPHHPCGWWQATAYKIIKEIKISIHTTRVGGDPLARGKYHGLYIISIHTTRVGGDRW